MSERQDYADSELPLPARARRWLSAIAAGIAAFVGVLVIAVVACRAIPPKTEATDSRADFAEWMRAMGIRATLAAGAATVAGIATGVFVFRADSEGQIATQV